jgi:hypothetical protein
VTEIDNFLQAQIGDASTPAVAEVEHVSEAARIAKAAHACANAGSVSEGVTISMEIDQLIYESGRLGDAASLLNRLSCEKCAS